MTFDCQTNMKQRDSLKVTLLEFAQICVHGCKCKVTNQLTDEIFNLAKRGAEKTNVDS